MPPIPPVKRLLTAQEPKYSEKKRPPAQIEDAYRAVWRSPFVRDTLGIPDGVGFSAYPSGGEEFASYLTREKTIEANTGVDPWNYIEAGMLAADKPTERNIMAHEIGHAYGKSAFPSYPYVTGRGRIPITPKTPTEETAVALLSPYSQRSPEEGLAQAYTNAVDFLSKTAKDTADFRETLGMYEGNTPGAGSIVRDLLKARPIYDKHPLKRAIR